MTSLAEDFVALIVDCKMCAASSQPDKLGISCQGASQGPSKEGSNASQKPDFEMRRSPES